jgi:hypothetical protein
MIDTLFDVTESDCHACGRPLRNSTCGWCAQNVQGTTMVRTIESTTKDLEWMERATQWRRSLNLHSRVTADDLTAAIGLPVGSHNQIGSLFHTWHKKGYLKYVRTVRASRKSRNAGTQREWEVMA